MTDTLDDQINCEIPELTPSQMLRWIMRFRKSGKSFYIESEPGVGKSYIINRIARENGYNLIDRRASGWAPDTAGGTLMQDVATRSTVWFPPEWLQKREEGVPNLYFFDELSAAHDMVRKPLFGFFLERKLNEINVDDGDLLAAAGNIGSFGTVVQQMDNATRGRFMNARMVAVLSQWVVDFAPFHREKGVHPAVVAYLKEHEHHFCMTEEALRRDLIAYGNPRNWTNFSDLIWDMMEQTGGTLNKEAREELEWAGASQVGTGLAKGCLAIMDQIASGHSLMELLEASPNKRTSMWPTSMGGLHVLISSMMSWPRDEMQIQRIMDLTKDFPRNTALQYGDMIPSIREVMLQKAKKLNISDKKIESMFGEDSRTAIKPILASGRPLIDLRAKAA